MHNLKASNLKASNLEAVANVLEQAVTSGDVPAAVAAIGTRTGFEVVGAYGVTCLEALRPHTTEAICYDVTPDTYFDLASLTKVTSTLLAILKLEQAGELSLDDSVQRFVGNAGWAQTPSLADVTVAQLLSHSSGLPAWRPLFAWVSSRQTALANALQSSLEQPTKLTYSDLGYITLGAIVESISNLRQDKFVRPHLDALGLTGAHYRPHDQYPVNHDLINQDPQPAYAATERCGWRKQLMWADVHDENAWVMGGVSGHAGLFGTVTDMARYCQAWLNLDARLGRPELLQNCTKVHVDDAGRRQGLGWHHKHSGGHYSFAGQMASTSGYGHTGFTGTSVWLEPEQDWFGVLLTNRVHPSRHSQADPVTGQTGIVRTRYAFYEAVAKVFATT